MKIWHYFCLIKKNPLINMLDQNNIEYEITPGAGTSDLLSFYISEDDPAWPEVADEIEADEHPHFFWTEFTPEEVLAARWARLIPNFERYYPQPEQDFRYSAQTFEWKCPKCGLEFDQKAPLRIKKEAHVGRHAFLKLYWIYAVLAIPEVIDALRAADTHGMEVWPVMLHRENRPSEVVSQIFVPTVAGPALAQEDKRQPEPCATCGVTKYAYHQRGVMRLDGSALHDDVDLQLTHEWFGSDTKTGHREFLVSNRIARLILEHGWTGAVLAPVELF